MKTEDQVRDKLRELRLAKVQIPRLEFEHWIEALAWVLNEHKIMAE